MPFVSRFQVAERTRTKGQILLTFSADICSFVIGATSAFTVHFVGDLYGAEIILILVLPFLLILMGKRVLRPELKLVYIFMGLWLVGLIVADAYNNIPIVDRLRGNSLIIFFGINILGLSMLLGGSEKRKIIYLIGLMVGALASVKLQPSPAFQTYPWKFGYAWGTIQLVMLVSSYFYGRRRYVISAALILGMCLVNLVLNYRGPVLDMLVTIVLVYPVIPDRISGIRILPKSQIVRLALLALLAIAAAETAGALVNFVTKAGYVNEEAQAKNESQAKLGFLGGRPEFVVGLRAAFDRPIIGHGSWAKDLKYLEMLNDMEVEAGVIDYDPDFEQEANGLIPGHSQIVTAWVWAGIAGLIFWMYMVWFFLKGMVRVAILRPPFAPYLMWFLVGTFWNIFFSPFAANRRIIEAVMIVFVADLMKERTADIPVSWRRMGAITPGRSYGQRSHSITPPQPR